MMEAKKYSNSEFPRELFLGLTKEIYGDVREEKLPKDSILRGETYVLFHDQAPIATATVYFNSSLTIDDKPIAFIGNFEALKVDCSVLFQAIENDLKEARIDQIIGPMNGSTWHEHRFIVDQFGPPFLSEMMHPNYYHQIWKQNGFETYQRYFSYKDTAISDNDARLKKLEDHFSDMSIQLRMIDLENFKSELERIYTLCIQSFSSNVLYSEITKEEFVSSYLPLQSMLKKEYIWIAENDQNQCLGFLFAFENKLNPTENEVIVKTVAKHPSFRYNGLGTLLGNQFMKKAIENKVTSVIHAFMQENNVSKNLSKRFNGKSIRRYELLIKQLTR